MMGGSGVLVDFPKATTLVATHEWPDEAIEYRFATMGRSQQVGLCQLSCAGLRCE